MKILLKNDWSLPAHRKAHMKSEFRIDRHGITIRTGWLSILRIDFAVAGEVYVRVVGLGFTLRTV